jgi:hypothetical protein
MNCLDIKEAEEEEDDEEEGEKDNLFPGFTGCVVPKADDREMCRATNKRGNRRRNLVGPLKRQQAVVVDDEYFWGWIKKSGDEERLRFVNPSRFAVQVLQAFEKRNISFFLLLLVRRRRLSSRDRPTDEGLKLSWRRGGGKVSMMIKAHSY